MSSLSFENIAAADAWILIIGCIAYFFIIWAPIVITLYLVYNRPNDKRSEKEFDQKWYKWKKQYMWHELWFRTHIIMIISLIVIFIFEASEWPAWAPPVFLIIVLLFTISLKITSRRVERRVPSDDEKKLLYTIVTGTMRSQSDAREYINEVNAEIAADNEKHTVASRSDVLDGTQTSPNGENNDNGMEKAMGKEIELQERTKDTSNGHHE